MNKEWEGGEQLEDENWEKQETRAGSAAQGWERTWR